MDAPSAEIWSASTARVDFGKLRASPLEDTTQWVSAFFCRELTDCSGRKKVCRTKLLPEFAS